MKREIVVDIICGLFVILFLYTGIMKLIDYPLFMAALNKSPLLNKIAPTIGIIVPTAEFLIAISLIVPRTRRLGLYSSLILMSIFTVYIGVMLYSKLDLPCTCGGIIQNMNWHQHFYFNSGFTFLAMLALYLDKKMKTRQTKNNNPISYILK